MTDPHIMDGYMVRISITHRHRHQHRHRHRHTDIDIDMHRHIKYRIKSIVYNLHSKSDVTER